MNHHGLFLKLMQRKIPVSVLRVIEDWFAKCATCVRWGSTLSDTFCLLRGVRQGGVLSPYLFAMYVNDIVAIENSTSDLPYPITYYATLSNLNFNQLINVVHVGYAYRPIVCQWLFGPY